MLSCIMSVYYIKENSKNTKIIILHVMFFLIDAYLQYLTDCRSAFAATLAVVVLFILFSIKKYRKTISLICLIGILILAICMPALLTMLSNATGRDWVTGSGRTYIFKESFQLIKQKPLLGYGTVSNYLDAAHDANLSHLGSNVGTHNIYIEIAILYGIPVLICFLASILTLFIKLLCVYLKDKDLFSLKLAQPTLLMSFILVFGLFEHHGVFRLTPPIMFLVLPFFVLRKNLDLSFKQEEKQIG